MRPVKILSTTLLLSAFAIASLTAFSGCGGSESDTKTIEVEKSSMDSQRAAMEANYKVNPPGKAAKKK